MNKRRRKKFSRRYVHVWSVSEHRLALRQWSVAKYLGCDHLPIVEAWIRLYGRRTF